MHTFPGSAPKFICGWSRISAQHELRADPRHLDMLSAQTNWKHHVDEGSLNIVSGSLVCEATSLVAYISMLRVIQ